MSDLFTVARKPVAVPKVARVGRAAQPNPTRELVDALIAEGVPTPDGKARQLTVKDPEAVKRVTGWLRSAGRSAETPVSVMVRAAEDDVTLTVWAVPLITRARKPKAEAEAVPAA